MAYILLYLSYLLLLLILSINMGMTYSIHGHISYNLEDNSKRPNDFSLVEGKPNDFYNLSEKDFRY